MRVLGETKLGRKEIDDFLEPVLPAAAAVAAKLTALRKVVLFSRPGQVPVTTHSLPKQTCEADTFY